MNLMWSIVYYYHGQAPGSASNNLYIAEIQLAIIAIAIVIFIFAVIGGLKLRSSGSISISLGLCALLLFSIFGFLDQIHYSKRRTELSNDAKTGNCTSYVGRVTNILIPTGDGHLGFNIEGHGFRYDSHHFALSSTLCSPGGPQICLGNIARICVHSSDGEILKIEKIQ